MQIEPVKDWVVLDKSEVPDFTGEIIIPDRNDRTCFPRARVVAVGPDVKDLLVGDEVYFLPNLRQATHATWGSSVVMVIKAESIVGKLVLSDEEKEAMRKHMQIENCRKEGLVV